jgi:hypothetical protein
MFKNALRCMSPPLGSSLQRILHCIIRCSEQTLPIHPCARARWPTHALVAALRIDVSFLLYCLLSTVYLLLSHESLCQGGNRWQCYFRAKNRGKHGENE